ncbi:MAG: cyclic nucleotide-binding domain-containing protein [Thermoleophilaceae bacterium]
MQTIEQELAGIEALAPLAEGHRATIAGCARNQSFLHGDYLMREGEQADVFYVIRKGTVALDVYVPQRGGMTIQTLQDGDLLGWSWLLPPYRVAFDARAVTDTHAISFDAACLRGKLEEDPALGYDLLKLFANVILERLQSTRLQLLDVYGAVPSS